MSNNGPKVLFGDEAGLCGPVSLDGCLSSTFEVKDYPVIIRAFNLVDGDRIAVEMAAGANEGEFFEQMRSGCGCSVVLTPCNNTLVLAASGRYRLNQCPCPDEAGEPVTEPANPLAHVEYQPITTGALVNYGEVAMACGCETGSQVSFTPDSSGGGVLVIDGVPSVIVGDSVSLVDAGTSIVLTVNGVSTQIDKGPDTGAEVAALLGLTDCAGTPVGAGAQIATCADLQAVAASIQPVSATQQGSTTVLTIAGQSYVLDNGADTGPEVAGLLGFLNCAGAPIGPGASLATCAELDAAIDAVNATIAGLPDLALSAFQSYDPVTNVLTLEMNDGSTVPVNMTSLLDDAMQTTISQATITLTDAFGADIANAFPA